MSSSILISVTTKAFRVSRIKILRMCVKRPLTISLRSLLLCNFIQYAMSYYVVDVQDPVILWWTPFTGQKGSVRDCGTVRCFFTEDRRFRNHNLTKVSVKFCFIISVLVVTFVKCVINLSRSFKEYVCFLRSFQSSGI